MELHFAWPVLTLLSSLIGGYLHPPPCSLFFSFSVQFHFCPLLEKINSFFLFSCRYSSRFLCFKLIYVILYSVDPHISLSVFISSFQAAASFYLSFFFCAACCLHTFGVFLPSRWDCYKPICFCAFAIIQGWLRILCTLTLKEHWGQRW